MKINLDGDLLFTVGVDRLINMYNLLTFERIGNFKTPAACKALDITNEGDLIAVACLDGLVYLYQTFNGTKLG